MGELRDGKWIKDDEINKTKGAYVRPESPFRHTIGVNSQFTPDENRYHLYVAHACPWANRATIMRQLKGLQDTISLSYVDTVVEEDGWTFGQDGVEFQDPLYGKTFLREIYLLADPKFSGRVTVPVLWDKHLETIVNNESSEIMRQLDNMNAASSYYPETLRGEIDEVNDYIYKFINNGVYRCGFANSQAAYDEAFEQLFKALDKIEARLEHQRYLVGDDITEADIRLFTTLIRFDPVYVSHFKCNKKRIIDYPNLWAYALDLYQTPGFGDNTNIDKIKQHYYCSHRHLNPTGIIPGGPEIDYSAKHNRNNLG